MINILAVFIGGGIGAALRYCVSMFVRSMSLNSAVFATLFVNIIGSFLIGFLCAYFINKIEIPEYYKLILTVGFCGGLTTFSTFSLELFTYIKDGLYLQFVFYTFFSVILCVTAVVLGGYFAKYFL